MRSLVCLLAFCACLLGWGSAAFAQNLKLGAVDRSGDGHGLGYELDISKADCLGNETFEFPYTASSLTGVGSLEVWLGVGASVNCALSEERTGASAQCVEVATDDTPSVSGEDAKITLTSKLIANRTLEAVTGDAPVDCIDPGSSTSPRAVRIFFLLITDGGDVSDDNRAIWEGTAVDLLGPAGVMIDNFTSGDSSVTLEFDKTGNDDVDQYQAYCFPKVVEGEGGGSASGGSSAGGGSGTASEPGSQPQGGLTGGGGAGGGGIGGTGGAGGAGTGGDVGTGGAGGDIPGGGGSAGTSDQGGSGGAGGGPACDFGELVPNELPPAGSECGEPSADLKTITGLDNKETYAIGVAAVDQVGNPGTLSNVVCVDPVPVDDFFKVYREAGGQGGCIGGCAVVADRSAELWWLLGGLAFGGALTARRRRRSRGRAPRVSRAAKAAGVVSGLLLLLAAAPAFADGIPDTDWRRKERPARPPVDTQFAFELRFAPYWPKVDNEPGLAGRTPYDDTFGNDPLFYIGLEFDYMPVRIPYVGTLGAAVGWGYTWVSEFARITGCSDPDPEDDDDVCLSSDETSLEIMPMHASLVLRGDELMRRTGVPLVPYGKFGFGWAFWSSSKTAGVSKVNAPGEEEDLFAEDVTIGLHAALGLALALNVLDAQSAGSLRESTGVGHAYLFAEWMNALLDGFNGTQMHVGTSTFVTGIAIDF